MSDERHWYRDAIIYELRVRSFFDSDSDGLGDLRGVREKLDYLQDLGVTAVWLLPFYPSPLRDDGYDIAEYTTIDPECGTLRDFRTFLRAAHRRGLKVITELVVNHTSDQHPWFQRARREPPGSRWRDFYVWSDTPDPYPDARIIFQDFEHSNWTWDPVAKAYYWHRFYSHQPDLNFDNPEVRRALFDVVDFWLGMGVDGMRLDAVPYLYEREGTSCENLPETHVFLKELRAHVDAKFENRMLLAEANQWPEDAVPYFGDGDECHMAFHFPIMPRLFMAIHMEDRFPILDILDQTPQIPETCQWALFLRNHDELTLEMVTDEERDYMWRVYARDHRARVNLGIRRRLAPLLDNNRRKIELMKALLLSLPGTPVLYYGDEIGMGDNVYLGDRNAVRTPMQWTPDRNAGFSRSNPQRLFLPVIVDPEYHYEALNVETQQGNVSSLLWWTKRVLALRKEFHAFGRGTLEPLAPANRKVLAFVRRFEGETLLVVANLSRFSQYVELDLSEWKGCAPIELFGRTAFPPIGELTYLLTLGPHAFYWFSIESPRAAGAREAPEIEPPWIEVDHSFEELLRGTARARLERLLPAYIAERRWFRGKARRQKGARMIDAVPVGEDGATVHLTFIEVSYRDADPEVYVLPLAFRPGETGDEPLLARLRVRARGGTIEGRVVDASADPAFAAALLQAVARRRRLRGAQLDIYGVPARAFRRLRPREAAASPPRPMGAEQTNTSWIYGDRLVGKLLRRLDDGASPELEMLRFLTERAHFPHTPRLAGHLEIRRGRAEPTTLMVLQESVPNEGEAWTLFLDEIERSFEELIERGRAADAPPLPPAPLLSRLGVDPPPHVVEALGYPREMARLLGQRTGELHAALSSDTEDPAFASEPFTPFSRRAFYQSLRNLAGRVLDLVRGSLDGLPPHAREAAEEVLAAEPAIIARFRDVLGGRAAGRLIRCHGDYHLGQVLHTGKDFAIIDFEGEPARTLGERRRKRSPLADVAGMLRSFHYAVATVLAGETEGRALRPEDFAGLEPWGRHWYTWMSVRFLEGYLEAVAPARVLPEDPGRLQLLLDLHLLEKALYEVGYELNNRPAWVEIPLRGLLGALAAGELEA